YPREDLYKWIRTSQKMIQEGHLKAIQVWEENERSIMNNFPSLTDEQIESILGYIDATHKGT
ncbi:MAG: cytochrome C, partial [Saprospiraceae bacterium]